MQIIFQRFGDSQFDWSYVYLLLNLEYIVHCNLAIMCFALCVLHLFS